MAEQLLENVRYIVEGQIDFDGQKLVELLATALLSTSAFLAFSVGYNLQNIEKALYIALGGTAVAFFITVPPWPFYKKTSVKWLPTGAAVASAYGKKKTL